MVFLNNIKMVSVWIGFLETGIYDCVGHRVCCYYEI